MATTERLRLNNHWKSTVQIPITFFFPGANGSGLSASDVKNLITVTPQNRVHLVSSKGLQKGIRVQTMIGIDKRDSHVDVTMTLNNDSFNGKPIVAPKSLFKKNGIELETGAEDLLEHSPELKGVFDEKVNHEKPKDGQSLDKSLDRLSSDAEGLEHQGTEHGGNIHFLNSPEGALMADMILTVADISKRKPHLFQKLMVEFMSEVQHGETPAVKGIKALYAMFRRLYEKSPPEPRQALDLLSQMIFTHEVARNADLENWWETEGKNIPIETLGKYAEQIRPMIDHIINPPSEEETPAPQVSSSGIITSVNQEEFRDTLQNHEQQQRILRGEIPDPRRG